ncbi:MAG: hypothetical protein ACYCZW_02710 [Minisyncoccota bacterium]
MNKKIIIIVIVVGIAFYGGMMYGKRTTSAKGQFGGNQISTRGASGRGGLNGGFTGGEILSKDTTGVTIKTQDGSTKIILIAPSTQVMKSLSGTQDDLITGVNVTITGTSNSDGSVTAQSVQIRPEGSNNPGARTGQ